MRARLGRPTDAASLARIYNDAIEDRTATFETAPRSERDVVAWFDEAHPIVVVTAEDDAVIAFARTSTYRPRDCYRGVFEFGIYTHRAHRRRGAAKLAMQEIFEHARAAGAWKLVSRIFVENHGSRTLLTSIGFREIGIYRRHAVLDGRWRDVVIVEKLLDTESDAPDVGSP
jgi:L-amino acid N-acyltransferase YncA